MSSYDNGKTNSTNGDNDKNCVLTRRRFGVARDGDGEAHRSRYNTDGRPNDEQNRRRRRRRWTTIKNK